MCMSDIAHAFINACACGVNEAVWVWEGVCGGRGALGVLYYAGRARLLPPSAKIEKNEVG